MANDINFSPFSRKVNCFGTSLSAGAGSTNGFSYPIQLREMLIPYGPRLIDNFGIGGQNSYQIAKRFGGQPITVTLAGGALSGGNWVSITNLSGVNDINNQFLSTPADTAQRYLSGVLVQNSGGVINHIPAIIRRQATGSSFPYAEAYDISAFYTTNAQNVTAGSIFYPDGVANYRNDINIFEMVANDSPSIIVNTIANIQSCVDKLANPKRYLVTGSAQVQAAFPSNWVDQTTPPTTEEMATIGFVPDAQDLIDIAAGNMPHNMMFDSIHRVNSGYRLMALRYFRAMVAKGWV